LAKEACRSVDKANTKEFYANIALKVRNGCFTAITIAMLSSVLE